MQEHDGQKLLFRCICIGNAQKVDLQSTCLIVGKSMMGKSSTANSLFNEPVAQVTSFQQDTAQPQAFKRVALGFEFTVIDTPGLLDGDSINTAVRLTSTCESFGCSLAAQAAACTHACQRITWTHAYCMSDAVSILDRLGLYTCHAKDITRYCNAAGAQGHSAYGARHSKWVQC